MPRPFILAPLLGLMALGACQTVEGAGRDLSSAGTAIAQESREVQSGL